MGENYAVLEERLRVYYDELQTLKSEFREFKDNVSQDDISLAKLQTEQSYGIKVLTEDMGWIKKIGYAIVTAVVGLVAAVVAKIFVK